MRLGLNSFYEPLLCENSPLTATAMQIYMLFVPDNYIVSQLFEDKNSAVVFELRTFFCRHSHSNGHYCSFQGKIHLTILDIRCSYSRNK